MADRTDRPADDAVDGSAAAGTHTPTLSTARIVAAAATPPIFVVLPTLLVGTLAVRLRSELGFDEAALGLAVASGRAMGAVSSALAGRAAERLGPATGLRLGTLSGAGVLFAVATVATSWGTLVPLLALSGLISAFTMPSADLWLTRTVTAERQGLAFGFRNAAPSLAALLAGLAVPSLAVLVGWRGTFAVAGAGALLVALLVPRGTAAGGGRGRVSRAGDVSLGPMVVLAVGFGFGTAAAGSLLTFLVSAAVAAGMAESSAGLVFALGAGLGVANRLLLGHLADRYSRSNLLSVAGLLTLGALGYLLLATGNTAVMAFAGPLAFATGWGWSGLFALGIVRANPNAPAAGTAITRTGGYVGGVVGPLVFGVLAAGSYAVAWVAAAGWALTAALGTVLGRELVRRDIRRRRA